MSSDLKFLFKTLTTLADGSFSIPNMPIISGLITAQAVFQDLPAPDLIGTATPTLPVIDGITELGTIILE